MAKETLTVSLTPKVSAADAAALVTAGQTALQALKDSGGLKLDKSEPKAMSL